MNRQINVLTEEWGWVRFIIDDFGTDDVFELRILSYSWLVSYPFHTLQLGFEANGFGFSLFELLIPTQSQNQSYWALPNSPLTFQLHPVATVLDMSICKC